MKGKNTMKNAIIKTNKLCKSFIVGKTGVNVLKNIDLEIYEGDFTVIMGSSGSGKSTLLYSLSTMDNITSGTASLFGKDISKASSKELANIRKNDVAFVFQSINLLPDLNAFENIAYNGYKKGNKKEINKRSEDLLKRFDLYDSRKKYPSELSGGQQQRIAIARALINQPKVLFGDEPTGALNSTMGQQVLDLMTELNNEGQSIVMVTHDLKAATRATRLLYLTDGRIDGDLNLGKYDAAQTKQREDMIYTFLKERGW